MIYKHALGAETPLKHGSTFMKFDFELFSCILHNWESEKGQITPIIFLKWKEMIVYINIYTYIYIYLFQTKLQKVFNRPGVAGAVL